VLDWNEPAIDFYRGLGAETMEDWTMMRLGEDQIEEVARADSIADVSVPDDDGDDAESPGGGPGGPGNAPHPGSPPPDATPPDASPPDAATNGEA
jgi:hypothetical protein